MTPEEKIERGLKKADRFLQTFRSTVSPTIPAQVAHTFILVARNPGLGVVDLAELAGTNKGTMSRHLLELSSENRPGGTGLGLLDRAVDPVNLKRVIYTLTAKGKLLRNSLVEVLED